MNRGGNVARADRFLILFSAVSFVAATSTSLPNVWHVSSGGLSVTQLAITILQWLVIITSALCVSMLVCRANAVVGKLFGAIVLVALPIIVVIDPIVLAWADQRFLSAFTVRVIPRLGQLIPHATEGTWRLIGAKTLMIVAILVAFAWESSTTAGAMECCTRMF